LRLDLPLLAPVIKKEINLVELQAQGMPWRLNSPHEVFSSPALAVWWGRLQPAEQARPCRPLRDRAVTAVAGVIAVIAVIAAGIVLSSPGPVRAARTVTKGPHLR
jgi:hypothetical protein